MTMASGVTLAQLIGSSCLDHCDWHRDAEIDDVLLTSSVVTNEQCTWTLMRLGRVSFVERCQ